MSNLKILCLHSVGTSGLILQKQLAPLTHAIGGNHEYCHVDGPIEHPPHSSVKDRFAGPYYCYYDDLSAEAQAEAHEFLNEVIEDDGPFDGVIAFSQGASLVTSYLLQHEMKAAEKPGPFKFAVLLSANLVVSPDIRFGENDILKEAARQQNKSGKGSGLLHSGKEPLDTASRIDGMRFKLKTISKHRLPGKKSEVADEVLGLLDLAIEAGEQEGWIQRDQAFEGKTIDDFPRIIHPLMTEKRIQIPTCIAFGENDPLFMCALVQKRLCDKKSRRTIIHKTAHDIPRAGGQLTQLMDGVKWAINRSQMAALGVGPW